MSIRFLGMLLIVVSIMYTVPAIVIAMTSWNTRLHGYLGHKITLLGMLIGMYLSSPLMIGTTVFAIWVAFREKMVWGLFCFLLGTAVWFSVGSSYFKGQDNDVVQDAIWGKLNLDHKALEEFQSKFICCGYTTYEYWCKSSKCNKDTDLPVSCYYDGLRKSDNILKPTCKDKIKLLANDFINGSQNIFYICFSITVLLAVVSLLFAWVVTVWPREDCCVPDIVSPCAHPSIPPCIPAPVTRCGPSCISLYVPNSYGQTTEQQQCKCNSNQFSSNTLFSINQ